MFSGLDSFATRLAMVAIVLELTVSANLLTMLGIPYVVDGGSLLCKLHPGTVLLMLSFVLMLARRGSWSRVVSQHALTAFFGFLVACAFYSLFITGPANLVVLLDTFLPAGLLGAVLSRAPARDLVTIRLVMQVLLTANAVLALAETAAHATLIPLYLNGSPYHPHGDDFRPTALLDHPLTGSVMAILGLALVPRRGRCKPVYLGFMWAALLAYGGRVSIGAALLMTCAHNITHAADIVLRRRAPPAKQVIVGAIMVAATFLLVALALNIGLGTRLAGHLYWDESAQIRLAQWQLLSHLDSWQLLLGTPRGDLLAFLVPLRLATGVEVIENFWLLMFVSLGLLGFPIFVGALCSLLTWCWGGSLLQGRLLILSVMLIVSTSNSIGRKSTILVCLVAAVACMPKRPLPAARQAASERDSYGLLTA